ncbi:hypothetical protein BDV93DRAFT_558722 [Ceratobasidium sp. AG-I]|nr:hypothetical protein BDV93DRAFT_558722 [Ceratobasidium sp. AG-I]
MSPRRCSPSAPTESTYSSSSPAARFVLPTTGETHPSSSQDYGTVLHLRPIASGSAPHRIVPHHATLGQAVALLSLSRIGNMVADGGSDGVYTRVFEARTKGQYSSGGLHFGGQDDRLRLRRGTQGYSSAVDRRRYCSGTLNLFAINLYGREATGASHLLDSGCVVKLSEPQRPPM